MGTVVLISITLALFQVAVGVFTVMGSGPHRDSWENDIASSDFREWRRNSFVDDDDDIVIGKHDRDDIVIGDHDIFSGPDTDYFIKRKSWQDKLALKSYPTVTSQLRLPVHEEMTESREDQLQAPPLAEPPTVPPTSPSVSEESTDQSPVVGSGKPEESEVDKGYNSSNKAFLGIKSSDNPSSTEEKNNVDSASIEKSNAGKTLSHEDKMKLFTFLKLLNEAKMQGTDKININDMFLNHERKMYPSVQEMPDTNEPPTEEKVVDCDCEGGNCSDESSKEDSSDDSSGFNDALLNNNRKSVPSARIILSISKLPKDNNEFYKYENLKNPSIQFKPRNSFTLDDQPSRNTEGNGSDMPLARISLKFRIPAIKVDSTDGKNKNPDDSLNKSAIYNFIQFLQSNQMPNRFLPEIELSGKSESGITFLSSFPRAPIPTESSEADDDFLPCDGNKSPDDLDPATRTGTTPSLITAEDESIPLVKSKILRSLMTREYLPKKNLNHYMTDGTQNSLAFMPKPLETKYKESQIVNHPRVIILRPKSPLLQSPLPPLHFPEEQTIQLNSDSSPFRFSDSNPTSPFGDELILPGILHSFEEVPFAQRSDLLKITRRKEDSNEYEPESLESGLNRMLLPLVGQ